MLIGFYRWVIFDKFLWSCWTAVSSVKGLDVPSWRLPLHTSSSRGSPRAMNGPSNESWGNSVSPCVLYACLFEIPCLIFFVWKFSHCSTSFSLTPWEGSRGRTTLPAQGWWATGPQWLSASIYKVKLRPCQNSLRAKPSNQSVPMCSCSGTTVLLPQKRRHVPIFVCLNQTCMVLCFSYLFFFVWVKLMDFPALTNNQRDSHCFCCRQKMSRASIVAEPRFSPSSSGDSLVAHGTRFWQLGLFGVDGRNLAHRCMDSHTLWYYAIDSIELLLRLLLWLLLLLLRVLQQLVLLL